MAVTANDNIYHIFLIIAPIMIDI